MAQGPSDWEKGVLAAAKWLQGEAKRRGETENDGKAFADLTGASKKMLEELTPDAEGTEARIVAQVAQFVRERSGQLPVNHPAGAIVRQLADEIEVLDWRQS